MRSDGLISLGAQARKELHMRKVCLIAIGLLSLAGCAGQAQQAAAPTASTSTAGAPTAPLIATTQPPTLQPATPQPAPTSAPAAAPTAMSQPTPAAMPTREQSAPVLQEYPVPPGSHPHDVAPAADGAIWYTAQASGELGRLDPATGETHHIKLGQSSAPHGVIVGPDGAPWITDGGLNAIVRVDPATEQVRAFPLPADRPGANLNTAVFDKRGVLWFTGQTGIYGRLDPKLGAVEVFDAPRGRGPYGITATPDGAVYYASLAGSHIARIDPETGQATPIDSPTADQGARRVWADSRGRVWVSEWNAGQVGMYDPADNTWREWKLPGDRPQAYAVYVDDRDIIWLSDFGANALVRFDPATEQFQSFPLPSSPASVRQIHGRPGEVWAAESGVDKLVVIRQPG
jgi:virginiamycin B lyase